MSDMHKKRVEKALDCIPHKELKTIEDITLLMTDQTKDISINRYRSQFLYRGMPNASFDLLTSLQRNCKNKQGALEKSILRNFAKYAVLEEARIAESVWKQMVIGQHHGLPTRLLDWSYSSLVALHFATSGEDMQGMDDHDSVVWRIDINEIHSLLPHEYRKMLKEENAYLFTIDMMQSVAKDLEAYDSAMRDQALVLLEPPSIDQRIINQYSYFSIVPNKMECIEEFLANNTRNTMRYIIPKTLRWRVRDMLDQLNVNERIMYPGLDGLTGWLKRHYYVK